jgi:hypothetical protein
LNKDFGYSWDVVVRNVTIADSSFYAPTSYQRRYLNWENVGRYGWTYSINQDNLCKGGIYPPMGYENIREPFSNLDEPFEDWGPDLNETMKGKIRSAIEHAAIY